LQEGNTSIQYYLHTKELFDELEKVHVKLEHGGQD